MKLWSISVCHGEKGESSRKVEFKKRWQRLLTPKEEKYWGLSLGSNYLLDDVLGDSDANISLVEEGNVDLHSSEEMKSSRRQAAEHAIVIGDDPGVGVLVGLDSILPRRVSLDLVIDFVTRLGPTHVEAIKGTALKQILQCRSFGLRRELALAFRIGRRLAFTVFDVILMTGLPAIEGRVEFDAEEVSGDLGRTMREHMDEAATTKSRKWKCQKEGRRSIM
ncbi:hypothetical protein Cgig2_019042 [Carnegiea gigantea]|uniref:Uncharacterized protein n=1 Tax=Carnegiea gigantea TaxID=171969 RepID=A0A9Q1JP15_9CARY|nr:hypothetical protein Cgig2_019042 [Carnegiea gigantea]